MVLYTLKKPMLAMIESTNGARCFAIWSVNTSPLSKSLIGVMITLLIVRTIATMEERAPRIMPMKTKALQSTWFFLTKIEMKKTK